MDADLKPGGKMIIMGEEHAEHPAKSPRNLLHRKIKIKRERLPGSSKSDWKPSADYLKAVSQCPLFKQGKGPILAVMQAVGLQDIQSISTEMIYTSRMKNLSPTKRLGFTPGMPYILVGVKPPANI
jgi:hypothetical protein